ncbi:MAG: tRNA pseudouridine(55) synthase TruB [Endomicrobium sp.]|jgi:tRNA pseudouridine55 synthase|nr:tRNA pseudouridine(55) synthase TruB [Endomicrobium sp.]
MPELSGMLLLDKPPAITSFSAANKIKKILNVKKTGHCGTLDPAATGLLLVLIGKSTKLQDRFMKRDKTYRCSFLMGTSTDTWDLDGKITGQKNCSHLRVEDIDKALDNFRGQILQIPPMYSALKHKGKKLYELAREGIKVERPPRAVNIRSARILSYENCLLDIIIECSSGTYIRSIARDLGRILDCGASVSALRREKVGSFVVENALTQKDFSNAEKIMQALIGHEELELLAKNENEE